MDIVERLIAYRDRAGRSREGRDLLAEACNEIDELRKDKAVLAVAFKLVKRTLDEVEQSRNGGPA
jgi:hypothetical protein